MYVFNLFWLLKYSCAEWLKTHQNPQTSKHKTYKDTYYFFNNTHFIKLLALPIIPMPLKKHPSN